MCLISTKWIARHLCRRADEINGHMQMIKGGGAALTREKIIASVAEKFICIADASKQVDILGKFRCRSK